METSARDQEPRDGHPVVAALLDVFMWGLGDVRKRVVPEARGRVLEIGAGTGANLAYYAHADRVVAIEPDPYMLRRARKKAKKAGVPVELRQDSAEALPFDDASFDTVVATWVLCTIPDPDRAATEMHRVLRPGGTLLFAEHIRAAHSTACRLQRSLDPVWKRLSGGCHLDRDSVTTLRAAGFDDLDVEPVGPQSWTIVPMVSGRATR